MCGREELLSGRRQAGRLVGGTRRVSYERQWLERVGRTEATVRANIVKAVREDVVVREWRCAVDLECLEMAEVLDGISDVKDVPMPIPGYQWQKDQSAKRRLRLINNIMFAHGDVRMTIILRPHI